MKAEPWKIIALIVMTICFYGFANDFVEWTGWVSPDNLSFKPSSFEHGLKVFILCLITSMIAASAIFALFAWLLNSPVPDPRTEKQSK